MSSLSAMALYYIHALCCRYLEFFHFHIFSKLWWKRECVVCTQISWPNSLVEGSFSLILVYVYSIIVKKLKRSAQGFIFKHSLPVSPVKFCNNEEIFTLLQLSGQPTGQDDFVLGFLYFLSALVPRWQEWANSWKRKDKSKSRILCLRSPFDSVLHVAT